MKALGEHLKKMHTAMASHHLALAKVHKAALGKAQAMESEGDGPSEFHKAAMDAHTQAGEYHAQCAKDLSASMKAAGMDGGDEIMPTDVHGVVPDHPDRKVFAVPRYGQREIGDVAAAFQKLVEVE